MVFGLGQASHERTKKTQGRKGEGNFFVIYATQATKRAKDMDTIQRPLRTFFS